jgi:hypothetical protein
MIKLIILTLIFLIGIKDCLKSDEICYKGFQCNNKRCMLSNCSVGLLNYDCDKFKCTLDAFTCDEYDLLMNEVISKRNSKLMTAPTEGLMKGISFVSKRLKKFEYLIKKMKVCSF